MRICGTALKLQYVLKFSCALKLLCEPQPVDYGMVDYGHLNYFLSPEERMHTLYKMGGILCVRFSLNYFTYFHILGANQLYNHFRCATYLSF